MAPVSPAPPGISAHIPQESFVGEGEGEFGVFAPRQRRLLQLLFFLHLQQGVRFAVLESKPRTTLSPTEVASRQRQQDWPASCLQPHCLGTHVHCSYGPAGPDLGCSPAPGSGSSGQGRPQGAMPREATWVPGPHRASRPRPLGAGGHTPYTHGHTHAHLCSHHQAHTPDTLPSLRTQPSLRQAHQPTHTHLTLYFHLASDLLLVCSRISILSTSLCVLTTSVLGTLRTLFAACKSGHEPVPGRGGQRSSIRLEHRVSHTAQPLPIAGPQAAAQPRPSTMRPPHTPSSINSPFFHPLSLPQGRENLCAPLQPGDAGPDVRRSLGKWVTASH